MSNNYSEHERPPRSPESPPVIEFGGVFITYDDPNTEFLVVSGGVKPKTGTVEALRLPNPRMPGYGLAGTFDVSSIAEITRRLSFDEATEELARAFSHDGLVDQDFLAHIRESAADRRPSSEQ